MKRINTMYLWSQSLTAKLCLTVSEPMDSSTPGFPVLHYLPEFAQIHLHWVNDAIQATLPLWPPMLSSCPQSFPVSGAFPVSLPFTSGGQSIGSFSISPSNEYSVLISFWNDWLYLLAAQGPLKSLFSTTALKYQFFGTQPSFMFQVSQMYMTTEAQFDFWCFPLLDWQFQVENCCFMTLFFSWIPIKVWNIQDSWCIQVLIWWMNVESFPADK